MEAKTRFLIKAQMFNGECTYGWGGTFPPIHPRSPAAGDHVQGRV